MAGVEADDHDIRHEVGEVLGALHQVAVGDGANDLQMMAICGLSVGFDAKAPVRDEANVLIDARDMSQLLPLLGLRG